MPQGNAQADNAQKQYSHKAADKAADSAFKGFLRTDAAERCLTEGTTEEICEGVAGPGAQKHNPQADFAVLKYTEAQIDMRTAVKGA